MEEGDGEAGPMESAGEGGEEFWRDDEEKLAGRCGEIARRRENLAGGTGDLVRTMGGGNSGEYGVGAMGS